MVSLSSLLGKGPVLKILVLCGETVTAFNTRLAQVAVQENYNLIICECSGPGNISCRAHCIDLDGWIVDRILELGSYISQLELENTGRTSYPIFNSTSGVEDVIQLFGQISGLTIFAKVCETLPVFRSSG